MQRAPKQNRQAIYKFFHENDFELTNESRKELKKILIKYVSEQTEDLIRDIELLKVKNRKLKAHLVNLFHAKKEHKCNISVNIEKETMKIKKETEKEKLRREKTELGKEIKQKENKKEAKQIVKNIFGNL